VQANPASGEFLMPTTLELEPLSRLKFSAPRYPAGKPYRLEGGEGTLSTFETSFAINISIRADGEAIPATQVLKGKIRYQACSSRACLFPASAFFAVPLRILGL
jgi:hypothetical protein